MVVIRTLLVTVALWAGLVGWLDPSAGRAETRVALVIGNSDYQSLPKLDNPVNDASDIAIALKGLGFDVFLGLDTTLDETRMLIGDFANSTATADVSLFYYAGHAIQVKGRNYLLAADTALSRAEDIPDQTIELGSFIDAMKSKSGIKLLFLDSCRNDPFGGSAWSQSVVGKGLAKVGTSANFLISYATQPGGVAFDGSGRNSYFTEAVLNHIYTSGQTLADLMIAVRRDVMASTGGRQIPWESSSLTDQFRFDPSPATVSEEAMLWQVAAQAGDPQLMRLYLRRYPDGSHRQDVLAFLQDSGTSAPTVTRGLPGPDADARAERLWKLARRSRLRDLLQFYLDSYPQGTHVAEARRLLQAIPSPDELSPGGLCLRLATHPNDRTAKLPGVPFRDLQRNALSAVRACSAATVQFPDEPHYLALLARATAAAGDTQRALELFRVASAGGDLRAMFSLARLLETGTGVNQDISAAFDLYERAAAAGSSDAMINLAVSLLEGDAASQDRARAIQLFERAAGLGSAKATYNLGVLAQQNVYATPAKALELFEKAAREGEYNGYRAAAILLDEGRGVPRDPDRAANMLLRLVAEDDGVMLNNLTTRTNQWSRDVVSAVQSRLKAAGYYTAAIDGLPGPSFSSALQEWRNGGFVAEVLTD